MNRGWGSILPGCGGIVGSPVGQLSPRAPLRPLVEGGREGALGRWGWGSENDGVKAICLLYYNGFRS